MTKIENDILFDYTSINNEDELNECLLILNYLFTIKDLAEPLGMKKKREFINYLAKRIDGLKSKKFKKAYNIIRYIRELIAEIVFEDRHPFQIWVPMLRYSLHMMALPNVSKYHKIAALACGSYPQIL